MVNPARLLTSTAVLHSHQPQTLISQLSRSEAAALILHRRKIRANLEPWCIEALEPFGFLPAAHHRLLIRELEWLAATPDGRLIVLMPPGSAKSTYASVLFPAWWLASNAQRNVIGVSYGSDLAQSFSRRVQSMIRENSATLGYGLASESVERWRTTHGSEYLATGSTAGITGYRSDLVIIDDPVKGRQHADSETIRNQIWNVYLADIYTRRRPGCRMVVIQTRWHEDDLSGRILQNDDGWRVVKLPAFATSDDDPLGRAFGDPLWGDDKYGYASDLIATRDLYERNGASRDWASLYQQDPRPAEGALFQVAKIETMPVAPNLRGAVIGRGWDLAATKQHGTRDPDWTVGVKLARLPSGLFIVLDVERFRGGPDEVDARIRNVADQDGPSVKVSIPQDPGQAGKAQVLAFTRLLSGHNIVTSVETGDKATRAAPAVSQVNGGNFAIVAAPWNRAFLDELAAFPSGVKDDICDALSRSFAMVGLGAQPLAISDNFLTTLGQR